MKGKYLPIGTVIKLKNVSKKVMIIGYFSVGYKNVVKMYDYLGCSFPEGMLNPTGLYYFNHSDISNIIYDGLCDDSFDILNNNLIGQNSNDSSDYSTNSNFINLKYDSNGVVIYDEMKLEIDPEIKTLLDSIEVKNPFEPTTVSSSSEDKVPEIVDISKEEKDIDNEGV